MDNTCRNWLDSCDLRDNKVDFQKENGEQSFFDHFKISRSNNSCSAKNPSTTCKKAPAQITHNINSSFYTFTPASNSNKMFNTTSIFPNITTTNRNNRAINISTNNNTNQNQKVTEIREIANISNVPEDNQITVPEAPPDGGFGWVVVISSFMISLIVDGLCYSQGIFFDEFRSEFATDAATASWVASVLTGTYSMVGPLVSAMVQCYGCRRVCFSGTIVAAAALATSTMSPDIVSFIFIYGLLTGIGFGMMYLPAIVMVGYYFERRRALATGIACCGSGMGTFMLAPLSTFLIRKFEWEGATYVLAGIMLSGVVFSLFYVPLGVRIVQDVDLDEDKAIRVQPWEEISDIDNEMPFQIVSLSTGSKKGSQLHVHEKKQCVSRSKSNPVSTGFVAATPTEVCVNSLPTSYEQLKPNSVLIISPTNSHSKSGSRTSVKTNTTVNCSNSVKSLRPLQRKDIFYSGDICSLEEYKAVGRISAYRKEISRPPSRVVQKQKDGKSPKKKGEWAAAFSTVFDVKLLKSPTFLLYSMACSTCMLGFYVPFTYLPLHAVAQGSVLPESNKLAFLISIIGISNVVSRIGVGFISDLPCVDCVLINSAALMVGGVATVCVPYYRSYWLLALYAAVFGTSIAVLTMLRSIIVVELMGLDKLTTAFGFVTLFQGAVSFVGGPIAGAISDMTGAYTYSFYMAGGALFFGGVICLPLRRVARWEASSKQ